VCAVLAGQRRGGRRARACAAVFGLVTASALLVHLSGGTIEMHFHFFVVVGLITLYQDWVPFGLALLYVVVHHGVLGSLAPTTVFSHPAAQAAPLRWALVHGAFVLAACAANLVTWRLSEVQAAEISRLVSRLEGLARTDPLTGIPNRRVWDEEVPTELERARRTGASLCLAMLDLDRFKDFNDHNGHQEGTGCSRRWRRPGGWRCAPPTCSPATAARSSGCCCPRARCTTPSRWSSASRPRRRPR